MEMPLPPHYEHMQNIIPIQSGVAFSLKKNQLLKVVDQQGQQVSDLFCINEHDSGEYFSAGRSMDYNDKIYLSERSSLYSNRSQAMLKIIEDTCGRHDLLMPPCSLKMFQIVNQNEHHHPSCHENLSHSLKPFGFSEDHISSTFNIFMNVDVSTTGQLLIKPPLSKAGDYITFQAEMNLIVALTSCSHEETNNFKFKPIVYEIIKCHSIV